MRSILKINLFVKRKLILLTVVSLFISTALSGGECVYDDLGRVAASVGLDEYGVEQVTSALS